MSVGSCPSSQFNLPSNATLFFLNLRTYYFLEFCLMTIRRIFKVFVALVLIYFLHELLEKSEGKRKVENVAEKYPTSLYPDYKYILAWNDGRDPVFTNWEMVKTQCPEPRCLLTHNRTYLGKAKFCSDLTTGSLYIKS